MHIYLSRWNLFGTMICAILGACLVTRSYFIGIPRTTRMTNILKFYWFLCNNSVVFACTISSIYWTMLYQPEHNSLNNYLVHATNSLLLLIDLFVIRHPHRLSHCIYPMTCGALYMLFTVVYTVCGGTDGQGNNYVYPILDWKHNTISATIVGVGSVLLLGIAHFGVNLIHRLREKLHQFVTKKSPKIKMYEQTLPFVNNEEGKK